MVRDEIDVIDAVLAHLLRQGVDHILVADHLSTDGTRERLEQLARDDGRIHVALDREPGHFQMEKMSHLSRTAWRAGAGWVIPFDADEFWFAEGASLGAFLRSSRANVIRARSTFMLPASDGDVSIDSVFALDRSGTSAPKVAFRAHPLALVGPGNHGVARVGEHAEGLHIAHLPYRGTAQTARKYRTGAAALDLAGAPRDEGWHWRAGAMLTDEEIGRTWDRMLAGDPVPALGWPGVDLAVRARVLAWPSWDPEDQLGDRRPRGG